MAINNSLSKKSNRQYILSIIVYITISLIILLLIIKYFFQNHNNEIQEITEKEKICYIGNINDQIKQILNEYNEKHNYKIDDKNCNITIGRNIKDINEYNRLLTDTYVFVQRYDGKIENINQEEINTILNTQKYKEYKVYWDKDTDIFLKSKFDIGVGQEIINNEEIKKKIYEQENIIGIIPINKLNIQYSVIDIDYHSPLSKEFNPSKYPLQDIYWIKGDKEKIKDINQYINDKVPSNNLDSKNLTSLILTGSSSIGGGALYKITNINKTLSGISEILSQTDIVHINNEISYTDYCIQTDLSKNLCAKTEILDNQIFKENNIKVIGVNGNHILDQGDIAFMKTLSKYNSLNIKYYGGGLNLKDKNLIQQIDHNTNNLSFVGYSYLYPFIYAATLNKAGNNTAKIEDIKKNLQDQNINIIDMSWGYEEKNELVDYQIQYTEELLKSKADIIIGTNSLIPQKIEIKDNKLVIYNLGSFLPYNIEYIKDIGSVIIKIYIYQNKIISSDIIYIKMNNENIIELADDSQKDTIRKYIK